MNKITENIYVGSWKDSLDKKQLTKNNIKNILCINSHYKTPANMILYKDLDIKHLNIVEKDIPQTNLLKHFITTNSFILDSVNDKQNVLIHCTCGISRAATTAIAYLLFNFYFKQYLAKSKKGDGWLPLQTKNKGPILKEIIQYVKYKRSIINPNPGFINQLTTYEHMLYSKNNS